MKIPRKLKKTIGKIIPLNFKNVVSFGCGNCPKRRYKNINKAKNLYFCTDMKRLNKMLINLLSTSYSKHNHLSFKPLSKSDFEWTINSKI